MTEQGSHAPIEQALVGIVENLVQDWGLELADPIASPTRLVADLDFASVDIIQLCVAIEENYERKLGFQDLLMEDGSYVTDLTIGQVAEFVGNRLKDGVL